MLGIDPVATAEQIALEVQNQNWIGIGLIAVGSANAFIHWFNQLRQDPGMFWQFLRSTNWWVTFATVAFAVYTFYFGIEIDPGVAQEIVDAAVNQDWVNLIVIVLINLINPLTKQVVKKPQGKVVKINGALKAA